MPGHDVPFRRTPLVAFDARPPASAASDAAGSFAPVVHEGARKLKRLDAGKGARKAAAFGKEGDEGERADQPSERRPFSMSTRVFFEIPRAWAIVSWLKECSLRTLSRRTSHKATRPARGDAGTRIVLVHSRLSSTSFAWRTSRPHHMHFYTVQFHTSHVDKHNHDRNVSANTQVM